MNFIYMTLFVLTFLLICVGVISALFTNSLYVRLAIAYIAFSYMFNPFFIRTVRLMFSFLYYGWKNRLTKPDPDLFIEVDSSVGELNLLCF